MPDGGDENQLMDELRRLEQSARNYQQEVSCYDKSGARNILCLIN